MSLRLHARAQAVLTVLRGAEQPRLVTRVVDVVAADGDRDQLGVGGDRVDLRRVRRPGVLVRMLSVVAAPHDTSVSVQLRVGARRAPGSRSSSGGTSGRRRRGSSGPTRTSCRARRTCRRASTTATASVAGRSSDAADATCQRLRARRPRSFDVARARTARTLGRVPSRRARPAVPGSTRPRTPGCRCRSSTPVRTVVACLSSAVAVAPCVSWRGWHGGCPQAFEAAVVPGRAVPGRVAASPVRACRDPGAARRGRCAAVWRRATPEAFGYRR